MTLRAAVSPSASAPTVMWSDVRFVTCLVFFSQLWYARGLGFYSDDWSTMAPMMLAPDARLTTLLKAATADADWMRPVQWLYSVILHWLFSSNPTGYHVSNGVVMAACCALFYLILLELKVARLCAVAAAFVYGFLPNYSTDRVWIAAFAAPLSVAWYLFGSYCDLRALRGDDQRRRWQVLSMVSLTISLLAYEHVLPLVAINAVYIALRQRRTLGAWHRAVPWTHVLLLAAICVFKFETTVRLPDVQFSTQARIILRDLVRLDYAFADDGFNLKQAVIINFWTYGAALPLVVVRIIRQYFDAASLCAALLVAGTIAFSLYRIGSNRQHQPVEAGQRRALMLAGLLVFCGGYAIFLTNRDIQLTPTGIGNRNAIAASLGVALILVGAIGAVAAIARARAIVFAVAIGLVCASGFVVLDAIAAFWRGAHAAQLQLLADLGGPVRSLPRGSTLLLDGACPYVGPAIVFENSWDFDGAVKLMTRDSSIAANVIRPRVEISDDQLVLCVFSECVHRYHRLFVYNAKERKLSQLFNASDARLYFGEHDPRANNGCPRGYPGYGVELF